MVFSIVCEPILSHVTSVLGYSVRRLLGNSRICKKNVLDLEIKLSIDLKKQQTFSWHIKAGQHEH